jgi:ribosomal protein L21E
MKVHIRRSLQILTCLSLALLAQRSFAAEQQNTERKFLRYVDDDNGGGKLQTAIATYKNADGVTVHLVAAVHVGEPAYYKGLQKTFGGYDALLYELIKPKDGDVPGQGLRSRSMLSAFQRGLKDFLDLDFQLDDIDYHSRNFVHADLDTDTFAKLQAERGESLFTLMLRQMLNEMSKPQANQPEVSLTELVVAFTSPDRARHFKLILGRSFEDMEAKVAGMEGPQGTVLVTERNKAAVRVLEEQIKAGKKDLGIFYGAAHMPDMEKRIEALGFKPAGTEWRTAWDMTPKEGDVIVKTVKGPTSRPGQ